MQDGILSANRTNPRVSRPTPGTGELLAALRAAYAAELPGLIRHIGALIDAAATDGAALARARVAAHRLRGTAGLYGFVAVGEAAGHLEDALDNDGGGPRPPPNPPDQAAVQPGSLRHPERVMELLDALTALGATVLVQPAEPNSSGSSK